MSNLGKEIAKIDFSRIFQQKKNCWESLTSGCNDNTFVGVTSKSTNLAKITFLVSIEAWSHDNSNEINKHGRGTF